MNLSKRTVDFKNDYFFDKSIKIPIITAIIETITTKATNEGVIIFQNSLLKIINFKFPVKTC
tara:strand:- start:620 stop:805 length:186 start_codon:yes stop_codon:yes gene_type:complete